MRKNLQIDFIPAEPGYKELVIDDDTHEVFVRFPIVAWRFETWAFERRQGMPTDEYRTSVSPVTTEGGDADDVIAILTPTGEVLDPDVYGGADTLEEYQQKIYDTKNAMVKK